MKTYEFGIMNFTECARLIGGSGDRHTKVVVNPIEGRLWISNTYWMFPADAFATWLDRFPTEPGHYRMVHSQRTVGEPKGGLTETYFEAVVNQINATSKDRLERRHQNGMPVLLERKDDLLEAIEPWTARVDDEEYDVFLRHDYMEAARTISLDPIDVFGGGPLKGCRIRTIEGVIVGYIQPIRVAT